MCPGCHTVSCEHRGQGESLVGASFNMNMYRRVTHALINISTCLCCRRYMYACSPGCAELLWQTSMDGDGPLMLQPPPPTPPNASFPAAAPYLMSPLSRPLPPPRPPPGPGGAVMSPYFMSSPVVIGGGSMVVAVNFRGRARLIHSIGPCRYCLLTTFFITFVFLFLIIEGWWVS